MEKLLIAVVKNYVECKVVGAGWGFSSSANEESGTFVVSGDIAKAALTESTKSAIQRLGGRLYSGMPGQIKFKIQINL